MFFWSIRCRLIIFLILVLNYLHVLPFNRLKCVAESDAIVWVLIYTLCVLLFDVYILSLCWLKKKINIELILLDVAKKNSEFLLPRSVCLLLNLAVNSLIFFFNLRKKFVEKFVIVKFSSRLLQKFRRRIFFVFVCIFLFVCFCYSYSIRGRHRLRDLRIEFFENGHVE